jgi:HEAT repeat protein
MGGKMTVSTEPTISMWIEALDSTVFEVRQEAKASLLSYGTAVIEPLIAATQVLTQRRCWEAAAILAQFDDPRVERTLKVALKTGHPILALAAVRGLVRYGEGGSAALIEALPNNRELTQLEIVQALEEMGSRTAVTPLMKLLRTAESSVLRYTIIQALGVLGDPQATVLIRTFLNDEDHHVRKRANIALERLASSETANDTRE